MTNLAINGGEPVRKTLFPDQNTMDYREEQAVISCLRDGRLSGYRANIGPHFYGGPNIKMLEKEWAEKFKAKQELTIACNSATSGLFIACAAINLKKRDEVIVTPYSMTCSATIPLWFQATPVFADVDEDYFCINPVSIASKITPKTKAIIAVDLFGHPCDYENIKQLISSAEIKYGHKIWLITDTAQSPGSMCGIDGKYCGTVGDIGVFSLNFGKHMTCGEGGMIITNNIELAKRCRLIMNHAEAVINDETVFDDITSDRTMIGLNLRMTELQASVARIQLEKLDDNIAIRRNNVAYLNRFFERIPAITPAKVRKGCTHSYYVAAYLWYQDIAEGLSRNKFINAVKAELTPRRGRDGEGVQISCGYIKPIYLMPWTRRFELHERTTTLPIVEWLWQEGLFLTLYHAPNSTIDDMMDICTAFDKCWKYRKEIR
jgi:perosamine synthetase